MEKVSIVTLSSTEEDAMNLEKEIKDFFLEKGFSVELREYMLDRKIVRMNLSRKRKGRRA